MHHTPLDLQNPLIHNPLIDAERAISEMRAGRPVVIFHEGEAQIVISAETVVDAQVTFLHAIVNKEKNDSDLSGIAHLVLTSQRLTRLGLERSEHGALALPALDLERITTLALKVDASIDAPVHAITALDEAALVLAQASQLVPAIVALHLDDANTSTHQIAQVGVNDIRMYIEYARRDIKLISRAPVPLEAASKTEFCVFRGGEGLRDQVAIIVGQPDMNEGVLVRMHSACLTGDLFGSLKCDCGDQLRNTVKFMTNNGGGILLYLDQEGRGNGIANKMRAYALQAKGWDTYDADAVFGFGADQRHFEFAAQMLVQLGVKKVRLMTNNPVKIAAIAHAGLELVDNQRVLGRLTAENVSYLKSKRENAGHLISSDYLQSELINIKPLAVCSGQRE